MKKTLLICAVCMLFCSFRIFSQETTDDIAAAIKQKIEYNVRLLDGKKSTILSSVFAPHKIDNPDENSYLAFKPHDLARVFIFDSHQIMVKEVAFEGGIFGSKLLNFHEVSLRRVPSSKVYLSPLFAYKNKCYYFLGAKNEANEVLFLFKIRNIEAKFALFDAEGNLLVNTIGLNKAQITEYQKIIKGEDEAAKQTFVKEHGVNFFLPYTQYFLFE